MPWWSTALVRFAGTCTAIAVGVSVGWPQWSWLGALIGYVLAHTVGWVLDRTQKLTRHPGAQRAQAQKYRLRATTRSGSFVAGLGYGLLGVLALAGTFGLVSNAVARRFAAGAPLLFVAGLGAVVVGGGLWLRRAVLSDVEVILGVETLLIRAKRGNRPWQDLRFPLSHIQAVTLFADPFGPARSMVIDAGETGCIELRASGLLAGRRARAAVERLGIDLLDQLHARKATRPYLARWGTLRYPTVRKPAHHPVHSAIIE